MIFAVGELVCAKAAPHVAYRVETVGSEGRFMNLAHLWSGATKRAFATSADYQHLSWSEDNTPLEIRYSDIRKGDKLKIVNDDRTVIGPAGYRHGAGTGADQWLTEHGYGLVNSNQTGGIFLLERKAPAVYNAERAKVGASVSYKGDHRAFFVKVGDNDWICFDTFRTDVIRRYSDSQVSTLFEKYGKITLRTHSVTDMRGKTIA